MKFPKLSALVPASEHFDESAVNEGVWLSEGHLAAVENGLGISATALAESSATVATLTKEVETLSAAQAAHATEKTATDAVALASASRIATLEAEVATLGKNPSGTGTSLEIGDDAQTDTKPTPSYLSDTNGINAWVDKRMRKK